MTRLQKDKLIRAYTEQTQTGLYNSKGFVPVGYELTMVGPHRRSMSIVNQRHIFKEEKWSKNIVAIETDGDTGIEASTKVIKSAKTLRETWKGLVDAGRSYGLETHHYRYPSGGGHIHMSLPRIDLTGKEELQAKMLKMIETQVVNLGIKPYVPRSKATREKYHKKVAEEYLGTIFLQNMIAEICNYPEIHWLFSDPYDISNCKSPIACKVEASAVKGLIMSLDKLRSGNEPLFSSWGSKHCDVLADIWNAKYESMSKTERQRRMSFFSLEMTYAKAVEIFPYARSGKRSAIEVRKGKNTVELRFFDMARSEEEVLAQVEFAQKFYLHVLSKSRNGDRIKIQMNLKKMGMKTFSESKTIVSDYITKIGLDPKNYTGFFSRMEQRFRLEENTTKRFLT